MMSRTIGRSLHSHSISFSVCAFFFSFVSTLNRKRICGRSPQELLQQKEKQRIMFFSSHFNYILCIQRYKQTALGFFALLCSTIALASNNKIYLYRRHSSFRPCQSQTLLLLTTSTRSPRISVYVHLYINDILIYEGRTSTRICLLYIHVWCTIRDRIGWLNLNEIEKGLSDSWKWICRMVHIQYPYTLSLSLCGIYIYMSKNDQCQRWEWCVANRRASFGKLPRPEILVKRTIFFLGSATTEAQTHWWIEETWKNCYKNLAKHIKLNIFGTLYDTLTTNVHSNCPFDEVCEHSLEFQFCIKLPQIEIVLLIRSSIISYNIRFPGDPDSIQWARARFNIWEENYSYDGSR